MTHPSLPEGSGKPPVRAIDAPTDTPYALVRHTYPGEPLTPLLDFLAQSFPRIGDQIKPLPEPGGRQHWIWKGPVRPDTGIPILHRYQKHKNVSVHRLLWHMSRVDSPLAAHHRLRRLASCVYPLCVHPGCFELASTPMERQTLADYMAQPVDIVRSITSRETKRRSKMAMLQGIQDRYIYRGDTYDVRCECGCGEITRIPLCPAGHVLKGEWAKTHESRIQMMGKQYRCTTCTYLANAARELRGSRPRAGFRPTSPEHNNLEREYEQLSEKWWAEAPTIGPGVDAREEREMQAMEEDIRRGRKPTLQEWGDEPVADGEDDMTYEQAMVHRGWPDD